MTIENIWNFDLKRGNGHSPKDGACLMDAISWFEYGTLGDHPKCSCPVISAYCRNINDAMTDNGRQKLKVFIPRLIGNRDTSAEKARAEYLVWQAIHVFTPFWLDKAEMCDKSTILRNFTGTFMEAKVLLADAANAAAIAAANAVDYAAAYATVNAVDYAANAVNYAANAVDYAAYAANAAAIAAARAAYASAAAYAAAIPYTPYASATSASEWEPLMIKALDGVLRIGKQAEPIEQERFVTANETFHRARERV